MKKAIQAIAIASLLTSFSAFAHHPAEDIVDPDIYEMIDENVADTPHADLDFTDMGN
ncbi:MAG: hypothetical protein AB1831_06675 [Pseudomonadota bacterium]